MHCHSCPWPPLNQVLPELGSASGLQTFRGCELWKEARSAGWEARPRQGSSSVGAGRRQGLGTQAMLCASTETPWSTSLTPRSPPTEKVPLKLTAQKPSVWLQRDPDAEKLESRRRAGKPRGWAHQALCSEHLDRYPGFPVPWLHEPQLSSGKRALGDTIHL